MQQRIGNRIPQKLCGLPTYAMVTVITFHKSNKLQLSLLNWCTGWCHLIHIGHVGCLSTPYSQGKVLWCDTRIPSILVLIVRTRCQRNTRGRKNPRFQAFGRYGVETTPKTVKSCVFVLERIAHFCDIFALHMLFASWRGSDIKQRQRNAHPLTPFHPQSPILECIRCQIKSFHSCGRNAAVSFGAVKWLL